MSNSEANRQTSPGLLIGAFTDGIAMSLVAASAVICGPLVVMGLRRLPGMSWLH